MSYINSIHRKETKVKFIKNKFFIACVAISLVLVIFTSVFAFMGLENILRDGANTLLYPVKWCAVKIKEGMQGFSSYFESVDGLISENESLRQEIKELEGELSDKQAIDEENRRLYEYLELKRTYPDYKLSETIVIAYEGDSYMSIITLNKGTGDGVYLGMPVIVKEGLVGSVFEVNYNSCKVKTLVEDSHGVGAYINRTGDIGIVEGDVMYKGSNVCDLNYLNENADIKEGDLVYTSGKGSIYPRGILIGKVSEVIINGYDRTKSAKIECAADLSNIKYAYVILSFDTKSDPIEPPSVDEEMSGDTP